MVLSEKVYLYQNSNNSVVITSNDASLVIPKGYREITKKQEAEKIKLAMQNKADDKIAKGVRK